MMPIPPRGTVHSRPEHLSPPDRDVDLMRVLQRLAASKDIEEGCERTGEQTQNDECPLQDGIGRSLSYVDADESEGKKHQYVPQ